MLDSAELFYFSSVSKIRLLHIGSKFELKKKKKRFSHDKDKVNLLRNPISIRINVHCANRNKVTGLGGNLGHSDSPENSQPLCLISHCQLGKWAATTR